MRASRKNRRTPRLGQLAAKLLDAADVLAQHPVQHLAQVAAGVTIVAEEGDPLWRQALAADPHQVLPDLRRNPGVQAVRNDVVELAETRTDLAQVAVDQPRVAEF